MIERNVLTYPGATSGFNWRPESNVIHSFAVGAFATLIAYQATAIVFDLFLSTKKRGKPRATDIGSLLLAEEASILSLCATFFPGSRFSTWKFHGFRKKNVDCAPKRTRFPVLVVSKLLLLVVTAPLLNIATVILSLEQDHVASFADVNFGGIAVGMSSNKSQRYSGGNRLCSPHPTRYGKLDSKMTEVFICLHATSEELPSKFSEGATATLSLSRNVENNAPIDGIVAEFKNETFTYRLYFHVNLAVENELYSLRSIISAEDGASILAHRALLFSTGCSAFTAFPTIVDFNQTFSVNTAERWKVSQNLACPGYTTSGISGATLAMISRLSIVNSDMLEVLKISGNDSLQTTKSSYVSGDNFPLIRRRRSIAFFVPLGMSAASLFILRIIVYKFTNNEVHKCSEMLLKERLGLKMFDSLLQNSRNVCHSWFMGFREETKFYDFDESKRIAWE